MSSQTSEAAVMVKNLVFAFTSPIAFAYPRAVAKALPSITLKGVEYAVLGLDRRAFGPRFLLRDAAGHLFGLFERGADASHFYAVPVARTTVDANPLERIQFLITDRGLGVA